MFNKTNKSKTYYDDDPSAYPVDSEPYQRWLRSLEPVYQEIMTAELRERARQAARLAAQQKKPQ